MGCLATVRWPCDKRHVVMMLYRPKAPRPVPCLMLGQGLPSNCCSSLFPTSVAFSDVAPTHAFITSFPTLHAPSRISAFCKQHDAIHGEFSCLTLIQALLHPSQAYLPHAGISLRASHRIIVLAPHLAFPLSRLAHGHPAIQRDRQPTRIFLVASPPSESSEAEPLGSPTGAWALQALSESGRRATMVGRIGANSSLLCTFGCASWRDLQQ
jgi:hypothetical protein